MDPIGLGFENFDGAGLFRDTENGQAVDDAGEIVGTDVAGNVQRPARARAEAGGQRRRCARCVTTQWFRYGYGRAETDDRRLHA